MHRLVCLPILAILACIGPPSSDTVSPEKGGTLRPVPAATGRSPETSAPEARPAARVEPTPVEDPHALLQRIAIAPASEADYDRKRWTHWSDEDGDCQDTRQEVLVAESVRPVTFRDDRQCKVFSGEWVCPYTGKTITDPGALDIEHVVPLAHAHAHGAAAWSDEERERFANSMDTPEHLIAVVASANRSKGARAPHEWLPSERALRCDYVEDWIQIKARWSLFASEAEHAALARYLDACDRGDVPELRAPEPATEPAFEPTEGLLRAIVEASIAAYDGNCPCPYHTMRNGRRCGKHSAYSRGGGDAPLCYERDVTPEHIEAYRRAASP